MNRELEGRVAIVTGAAQNIGRAIAVALGSAGASVAINAKTSADLADETARAVRSAGGKPLVHLADISDPEEGAGLIAAAVKEFGGTRYPRQQRGDTARDPLCRAWLERMARSCLRHSGWSLYLRESRAAASREIQVGLHRKYWGAVCAFGRPKQSPRRRRQSGACGIDARLGARSRPRRHHRQLRCARSHRHRAGRLFGPHRTPGASQVS